MPRKLPFTQEEFKSIYSRVPRLCVDLIIVTKEGVLLTLRQKNGYEGLWHLPGGTVYLHEKLEEAVNRIAQEELGVEVKVEKQLGYLEYLDEVKIKGFGHSISIVYLCSLLSDQFTLDDQVERLDFFKVLPMNIVAEQREIIQTTLK